MMRDIYSAEELQDQLQNSKQEVQDLTCDLTEAQEAYQAISTERDRLADEVQGFQTKLDTQENESKQALVHFNEQKEKAKRIVKAQQLKFKALEVKHEELKKSGSGEQDGAANSAKDAEIENLKKELLEKTEEYEAYQARSKGQIDNLFQQMTEMENSSLETEKNKEEMDQKLSDLKSHENEINDQLAQALEIITTLKSDGLEKEMELESKSSDLESTKNHLDSLKIHFETLKKDLEQANSNLDCTTTELDSMKNELNSKQGELESTKSELESTQNVLDSTKILLEESNAGFEHEISDLKRAISEKVEITEQLKSGNSDEVTNLRNEFESSKNELTAKQQQIDDLKEQVFSKVQQMEELRNELSVTKESFDDSDAAFQKYEEHISTLKTELNDKNGLIDAGKREIAIINTDIESTLEQIKVQESELSSKNQEISLKNDEISVKNADLSGKISELTVKSIELESQSKELQKFESELKNKTSEFDKLSSKFADLTTELETKSSELTSNKSELTSKMNELERLKRASQDADESKNSQFEEIEKLHAEISDLNAKAVESQTETAKLGAQRVEDEAELNQAAEKIVELEIRVEEIDVLKLETQKLESLNADLTNSLKKMANTWQGVKTDLVDTQHTLAATETKLDTAETRLATIETELKTAEANYLFSENSLKSSNEALEKTSDSLTIATNDLKTAHSDYERANVKISSLDQELATKKAQIEELESNQKEIEEHFILQKSTNSCLQINNDKLEQTVKVLNSQVNKQIEVIEQLKSENENVAAGGCVDKERVSALENSCEALQKSVVSQNEQLESWSDYDSLVRKIAEYEGYSVVNNKYPNAARGVLAHTISDQKLNDFFLKCMYFGLTTTWQHFNSTLFFNFYHQTFHLEAKDTKISSQTDEIHAISSRLTSTETTTLEFKSNLQTAKTKLKNKLEEIEELRKYQQLSVDAEESLQTKTFEIEQLTGKITDLSSEIENLNKRNENQSKFFEDERTQLMDEINSLSSGISAKSEKLKESQELLVTKEKSINGLSSERDQVTRKMKAALVSRKELIEQEKIMMEQIKTLKNACDQATDVKDESTSNQAELQGKFDNLESENRTLSEKIDALESQIEVSTNDSGKDRDVFEDRIGKQDSELQKLAASVRQYEMSNHTVRSKLNIILFLCTR